MTPVKENTLYKLRNGWRVGPLCQGDDGFWRDAHGQIWLSDGHAKDGAPFDPLDIIAEWSAQPNFEADAVAALEAAIGAAEALPDGVKEIGPMADGTRLFESDTLIGLAEDFAPRDAMAIADEAKRIVNGARRGAYGKPEQNFERIARFWQAYFENTGRPEAKITAADVSPMLRLMKEARLCETPGHYDSHVDLVGYTLTGAEVNKVKKPS